MSYPDQAPVRRPGAVVSAAVVLVLMAVAAVAYAVAGLLTLGGTVDRFQAAASATGAGGSEIDGVVSLLRASTVLSAVVTVLVGLMLVALALGLRAARPGARVTTWVVCGLGLLCGCCALALLVGQRAAPLRLGADERVTADLLARLGDAYPSWWIPLNAVLSVAQILGYLVVAALLTLPAANAFFRRPAPVGPRPPAGPIPPGYGPAPAYGPPSAPPSYGPPSAPGPASAPPGYAPPSAPTTPAPPAYGSPVPPSAPPAPPPPAYGSPAPGASPTSPPPSAPPGQTPPASAPPGPTPPPEDRP